ncbi:MAG: hypothetical protein ACPGPF_10390 [Pontibacterium sp.]
MSIFTFPNLVPSQAGFNVVSNSGLEFNENNGIEYVNNRPGERFFIEMTFAILKKEDALTLKGHLQQLMGGQNYSLIKDLGFTQRGNWSGTPRVNGALEYGLTLSADGMGGNQTVARVGDRFKLGDRVHELVTDVTTNASGQATFTLANEIIDIPADDTLLLTDLNDLTFKCRWLNPEEIQQFNGNKSYFRNIKLTFIEALA